MNKKLGIFILVLLMLAGVFTVAVSADEVLASEVNVLSVTFTESIDMLSTAEIKVGVLNSVVKEELSKVRLTLYGGDAWFEVFSDKGSDRGTEVKLYYTYDGEDEIQFKIKPQDFFLENTRIPFKIEFIDGQNQVIEFVEDSFEMTTVTYEITPPDAGGYESVDTSFQYPILNAGAPIAEDMPELSSGYFFNFSASSGQLNAKSMALKATTIMLRYHHQASYIAMDHELAKNTLKERFKDYVYIGSATGFGEVNSSEPYTGGFVGELDDAALAINQSHFGIYSFYKSAFEASYSDGWGSKPYIENGEQVYSTSILKTRTIFVGDEIVTAYARMTQYATASNVEAKQGELEAQADAVLDSFKVIGLNPGKMKEVFIKRKVEGVVFTGYAVDYLNAPIRSAEVIIHVENNQFKGVTDENGYYEIVGEGIGALPNLYFVQVYLRMKVDDTYRFSIIDETSSGPVYGLGTLAVEPSKVEDLHQIIELRSANLNVNFQTVFPINTLDRLTVVYQNMYDVVKYYEDSLSVYDEFTVPEANIFCDSRTGNSAYFRAPNTIVIPRSRLSIAHPNNPTNREYHEYNHMIMYSMYGSFSREGPIYKNHNGFMNSTTGDSFVEGFAEFMALVTADYYDSGNGSIYANIGNFDMFFKPWHEEGLYEELAVASLLWKIYDGIYAEELNIPFEGLWDILKTKSDTFGEFYDKLIAKYSDKKGTIDALYIAQGFFEITGTGNGIYDANEPFNTSHSSGTYQAGDVFIDLPEKIEYDGNSPVGYAADATRSTRKSPLVIPGNYIKTEGPDILYVVTYTFEDHPEWNYSALTFSEDGFVAVNLPPDEYVYTIEVVPDTAGYAAPLVVTREEMLKSKASNKNNGYLMSHDFDLDLSNIDSMVWNQPIEDIAIDFSQIPYPFYGLDDDGKVILLGNPVVVESVEEITEATTNEEIVETTVAVDSEKPSKGNLFVVVGIGGVLLGVIVSFVLILRKRKK